jgi:hypothetical protein
LHKRRFGPPSVTLAPMNALFIHIWNISDGNDEVSSRASRRFATLSLS